MCSDAPHWDWGFFCDLAFAGHQSWPDKIMNQPINLTILFAHVDAEVLEQVKLSDLPHHALLNARELAELFKILASRFVLSP